MKIKLSGRAAITFVALPTIMMTASQPSTSVSQTCATTLITPLRP